LSGAHVDGFGRSGRNARGIETLSRTRDHALPAAIWTTRGFNGEKDSGRKLYWPTASCAAAKFHQQLFGSRRPGALTAKDRDQRPQYSNSMDLREGIAMLVGVH